MKKIPSLFERDWNGDRSRVIGKVAAGCEWVANGEGIATRKFDGSPVMIRDGKLYKRYDCKNGKSPPPGFDPCQEPDPVTGHWPGWVPVNETAKEDRWFREAWKNSIASRCEWSGTYEACGPHFQGNPEQRHFDVLVKHGEEKLPDAPRTFSALAEWFKGKDIEGIVWHHPDGRMCKIKKSDFGLRRNE